MTTIKQQAIIIRILYYHIIIILRKSHLRFQNKKKMVRMSKNIKIEVLMIRKKYYKIK